MYKKIFKTIETRLVKFAEQNNTNFSNLTTVFNLKTLKKGVGAVVIVIEALGSERGWSGKEKRKILEDYIWNCFLYLKIKYVPKFLMKGLIRFALTAIVRTLNKELGDYWRLIAESKAWGLVKEWAEK